MKNTITLCIIGLLFSSNFLFGQTKSSHEDSLSNLLCKKWEVDYMLLGTKKITSLPNAEEINYVFNKDRSLVMMGRDSRGRTKGKWSYDRRKKIIKLTIKGKTNTVVASLNENELVLLADSSNASDKDLPEIKFVYKIKTAESAAMAGLASN
ncbi:MAG: hypothetical protein JST58_10275 [Bacteroidetes bacterium]|jgi:hypothetical protein|nr:hypothetical protein [Bacteroidota bacterium]